MNSLVFDTGTVISLTTNNLLWLVEPLKEKFKGDFYITKGVERELVTKPLESKKFKFEALQILELLRKNVIKVIEEEQTHTKALELLDLANNCFKAYDHPIKIVSYAEMESLAAVLYLKSKAMVIDERTTRELIENPLTLKKILERKLHTNVAIDKAKLREFRIQTKNVGFIRSVELVTIAYETGLLDRYIANVKDPKKTLLESLLWAVKLNGCSVSEKEINQIIREELR